MGGAQPTGAEERDGIVRRRLVVHVGGFDLLPPAVAYRRFGREIARFERTWGVETELGPSSVSEDLVSWTAGTTGPNWSTVADIRWLRWDDVIEAEAARPWLLRLGRGLWAFADFVGGGALLGYCRTAWRYAGFFLYPFLLVAVFAAIAIWLGAVVASRSGYAALGILAGAAAFALALAWPGRRLYLFHLLDDWSFARDLIRRDHPVLGPRLDRIARLVADERTADEIVVVGHSLGAVLAVEMLARAAELRPGLGREGPPVTFLSVGASLLKVGLHAGAARLRVAMTRVADAPGIRWFEFQSLIDVMNFYKTDPVAVLGLRAARHPVVRIVRISRMLEGGYYMRIKLNFFRIHNQFVSGNDLRAPYDYFMMTCGPIAAARQADAKEGAAALVGPDGAIRRDSHLGAAA